MIPEKNRRDEVLVLEASRSRRISSTRFPTNPGIMAVGQRTGPSPDLHLLDGRWRIRFSERRQVPPCFRAHPHVSLRVATVTHPL